MAVYLILKQVLKRAFRGAMPILFGATLFVILVGSLVVYFAENGTNSDFQNWGDALWWIVVTISTVGYGDKIPLTFMGRIIAFIAMIAGPVILVSFVGSAGTILYDEWQKGVRGMSKITAKGHIIICGWNSASEDVIAELRQSDAFKKTAVTIIDDTIDTNPLRDSRISFVRGNPTEIKVLEQANVKEATHAIVLAKDQSHAADPQTILTVLAIKDINPKIYVCAEINNATNEDHVRRAGCDVIINANVLTSKLLALSLENPVANAVIAELASFRGSEIYRVKLPRSAEGLTFDSVFFNYKKEYKVILIGIERNNEVIINPSSDLELKKNDCLFVISENTPDLH